MIGTDSSEQQERQSVRLPQDNGLSKYSKERLLLRLHLLGNKMSKTIVT